MADKHQKRILDMQRQVRVARDALTKIKSQSHNIYIAGIADQALDQLWPLDDKRPLQGLVGHEKRPQNR